MQRLPTSRVVFVVEADADDLRRPYGAMQGDSRHPRQGGPPRPPTAGERIAGPRRSSPPSSTA